LSFANNLSKADFPRDVVSMLHHFTMIFLISDQGKRNYKVFSLFCSKLSEFKTSNYDKRRLNLLNKVADGNGRVRKAMG
jgi:hypothetical protein